MTEHSIKTTKKYSFPFILSELASFIIGTIAGGIITFFLTIHLNPKLLDSRDSSFSYRYTIRPYEGLGVVDAAEILQEHAKFLDSLVREKSLAPEDLDMSMLLFLERFHEAIDQVRDEKKVNLLDAKSASQLPDYTIEVKRQIHLLEDPKSSHKETTIQKEEDHS